MPHIDITLEAGFLRFRTSTDLPAAFRRQVAAENMIDNDPRLVRKGAPERIPGYAYNEFNGEVRLPLTYRHRLLELAQEHGISVNTIDLRPWASREEPVEVAIAVRQEDLSWALDHVVRQLLSARLPSAWETVHLVVWAGRHRPEPVEIRGLGPASKEEHMQAELPPYPWPDDGGDGDGGPQAPGPDPAKARPHHPRRRKVPPVPEPGGADRPG